MKNLIKKYEEMLKFLEDHQTQNEAQTLLKGTIEDLKKLSPVLDFENNERILLKRLVTNEIETPRKKYGTIKMNTLFTLQEKLKK